MTTLATIRLTTHHAAEHGQDAYDSQSLNIAFDEASYDHTCVALQGLIDTFPSMVAGDNVTVEFIHARERYSATFSGVMPRNERNAGWPEWAEFVHKVRMATR